MIEIGRIGEIGKHHVHAPRGVHFGEQIVAAAVNIAHGDNGVAGAQKRAVHAVDTGHAAAKRETGGAFFQRGDGVFQYGAGGVAHAGVAVGNLFADFFHLKHAVLINRRHDGAVVLFGLVAAVDGFGGETVFHDGFLLMASPDFRRLAERLQPRTGFCLIESAPSWLSVLTPWLRAIVILNLSRIAR